MRRALLSALAIPAVLSTLACGGALDALTGTEPTALERAQEHCGPALNNTRLYEDVSTIDQAASSTCEHWYANSASEDELVALACMAGAQDQVAWDLCRAPFSPVEADAMAGADRYGLQARRPMIQVDRYDRDIAENAGILGALMESGDLEGVFGTSALDSDLAGGIGGLIGAKGVQIGSGGLGSRGSGLGGGGTAEGLGGLGTRGTGGGASGYGSGGGSFGTTTAGASVSTVGDPVIMGALDRSVTDAVVKRRMNQIRYCYQREITSDPNIAGKVVVKFVVAGDGTVSSASIESSTMGNTAVESCVTSRFLRMMFPEPKGGGIVVVSYAFLFSPG